MEEKENRFPKDGSLTHKDFYDQACNYFYYHAEQRTTMINYFIAVFAASIALYGTLLSEYTVASMLIAVFLTVVSLLFFMIDLRNKFDVKESENVIRQFERDYGADIPGELYPHGVFSNETNSYKYYGYGQRKGNKKGYRQLRKLYEDVQHGKATTSQLDARVTEYLAQNDCTVSAHELKLSLGKGFIIPLSFCIKMLYITCMVISILAFFLAAAILCGLI